MPVGEKHNLAHRDRIGASADDRDNAVPVNEKGTKLHDHSDPSVGRMHLLRSCICEFIGTFFLCFAVGLGKVADSSAGVAIGLMLGVYVYAFGHISGANFNPAVSLALFFRGKLNFTATIVYVIVQIIAGFVGGAVSDGLINDGIVEASNDHYTFNAPHVDDDHTGWALFLELLFTFMLVSCVLHTATTKAQAGNHFYGGAIGMSVTASEGLIGHITGCALNPAVGIGLPIIHNKADNFWVYVIGPCMGSMFAVLIFSLTAEDNEHEMVRKPFIPQIGRMMIAVPHVIKSLIAEFFGTMYLVMAVALTVDGNGGALAIGLTLMVMIYTFGHVSGAHFNPAVTVAIFARGNHNIEILDAIGYIMAQTVGGFLGAGIAKDALEHFGISNINYPSLNSGAGEISGLIVEILGTFTLASVVLNVATTKSQAHNSFFGGAIGLTVTAWAYVGGPISGGAFNPAVGLCTTAVAEELDDLWLYILGPLVGGILAGLVFRFTAPPSEWDDSEVSRPMAKSADDPSSSSEKGVAMTENAVASMT